MMMRLMTRLKGAIYPFGMVLPLVLVLLAAAALIVVPGLFASQIALGVNRDSERNSRAYFAAEAGVADALWKFRNSGNPFAGPGSSYQLNATLNGLTVDVTLLNQQTAAGTDHYYIQSAASSGTTKVATVIATITQRGSSGDKIFDYAVVSLDGNIDMQGSSQISSDDASISSGDAYANGNIYNSKYKFGPVINGDATGTGIIDSHIQVNGARQKGPAISGTPVDVALYKQQAQQGGTVASYSRNSGEWYLGGPGNTGYILGDLTLTGTAIVNIVATVYVGGKISLGNSSLIKGGETIVCDGNVILGGAAGGQQPKGTTLVVIAVHGGVTISESASLSAAVYAPEGQIKLDGASIIYGAAVGKNVLMAGGAHVKYATDLRDSSDLPGGGYGVTTTLSGYDYR